MAEVEGHMSKELNAKTKLVDLYKVQCYTFVEFL